MAYTRLVETPDSNEQYFVEVGDSGVNIILPGVGKVLLDKDGFVNLLNYLIGYDYTLAIQEKGYYYTKAKAPLGYYSTQDGSIVVVNITLAVGKIPDVTFKTISTENGKITSEVVVNSRIFSKIISLAKNAGIVATKTPITAIKFVDALPAETSAKRGTVYSYNKKYFILNANEDALTEITGDILIMDKFPATESPAKENTLYLLTDEQVIRGTRYKRGLYLYNKTKNEYAIQDLILNKIDKLPDVAKAKENGLYLLTKNETDKEGNVTRAKGTVWKVSEGKFVAETRKIVNVGKLEVVDIADADKKYLVNDQLNEYDATKKKFNKIGIVEVVEELPDITKIQLTDDIVYTLTENDGNRLKGTNWIFDLKTKEFKEYDKDEKEETTPTPTPT